MEDRKIWSKFLQFQIVDVERIKIVLNKKSFK